MKVDLRCIVLSRTSSRLDKGPGSFFALLKKECYEFLSASNRPETLFLETRIPDACFLDDSV
jgi:hypothetical protein